MASTPDAKSPPDDTNRKGNQDSVLIISENPTQTTELSRQLAVKGYKTLNLPLFSAFDNTIPEHVALIIAVNCQAACAEISGHIRRNGSVADTPVICINPENLSDWEPIGLESLLAKTNALDTANCQIQLYRHCPDSELKPDVAVQGRRAAERRQSTPVVRPAKIMAADIRLAIVSQREAQTGALLAHFSDISAAHCINSLDLVTAKLQHLQPALLLVDSQLTQPAVDEWLQLIRQSDTCIKIILLYDDALPDLIKEIVEYGVSGVIPTDASGELYRKAIRTVHQGELWLPHLLMSQIMTHFSQHSPTLTRHPHIDLPRLINTSQLTLRELSITERVAQGLTNKQIAKELKVSPETVKKHLKSIFEKSAVRSRSQLASAYSHAIANGGAGRA